ncbi:uncharacterized protein LOC126381303 [Pectinophora gossypiella]|uniref:uncharacterized protein LOC126381303 n=1 Tax=Pectinophora gossypiella TaxID=13191 RepID=UPI00214E1540|nr:uncharacterized protein LOC126381303 [Pectinophora gossypiella]
MKKSTALLATALIPVKDKNGQTLILRALIDQGSQANFISERATQLLKIKKKPTSGTVSGVGSTQTAIHHVVEIQLLSQYEEEFQLTLKAYVMPTHLCSQLPSKSLVNLPHAWPHIQTLTLADPTFNQPGRVDVLLGVEVYAQILKNNIIRGPPGSPCAQETSLGWILFGNIQSDTSNEPIMVMHHQIDFDDILYKLWEVEADDRNKYTKEEETCQTIYQETVRRNQEGRYIVKLPFKTEPPKSTEGKTREIAMKRLNQMEKRLERNKELQTEYNKVMKEYIELNHMELVPKEEIEKPSVYLPHHAVVREASDTTKVRVVFNASSPDINNICLNDEMLVGPQLQEDMRSIVMRWRLRKIAFVSDVEKMYRQILVTKEDTDYQRILWRDDPEEQTKDYRLLRVTFGTASAPYLAVITLQQVAEDEGEEHPEAKNIIQRDFFMDDLISGQDTVEEALQVARDITTILKKGGFKLQKWSCNNAQFLKEFSPEEISTHIKMDMNLGGTVRTLGLSWNLGEDVLQYNMNLPQPQKKITKRSILAEMQHYFDPLGWLAPGILPAKLLLQKLWLKKVTWDEKVEPEIEKEWLEIRQNFEDLKVIKIDRWLQTTKDNLPEATIHGFCDASMKAYGAAAYLRVIDENGVYKTQLIAARCRVAPIKPVSLPRQATPSIPASKEVIRRWNIPGAAFTP